MVEHIGPRFHNNLQRPGLAQEIRCQHFDRGIGGGPAYGRDDVRKMPRAAVLEVITVHRGNDHMTQAELGHCVRHTLRFVLIERMGQTGGHVAERTGAGADLAHDHHGGMALGPALPNIGAGRFLTHRHELVVAHQLARLMIDRMTGRLHTDPVRLARNRIIRAMRLFRMARRRCCLAMIYENANAHLSPAPANRPQKL